MVGLTPLGNYIDEPEIAVGPDGTAVAIWVRFANPDYPVESTSRSSGGTWSPPAPLTAPGVSGAS
ncbi:MAG TPA: hypothetical protein VIT85_01545, partial [Solirubrobacterales bacterium]